MKPSWWAVLATSLAQVALGLAVAFAIHTPLFDWHQSALAQETLGTPGFTEEVEPYRRVAMGMLGGTLVSWGVLLVGLTLGPLRRGEKWPVPWMAASVVIWFFIDTPLSAQHGAWSNVAFNVGGIAPWCIVLPWYYLQHRD